PACTIRGMNERREIVVDADVGLAEAPPQDAIKMRGPVVLVMSVIVDDVVAEVRDFLRDRELRLAAPKRLFGIAPYGHIANESDEARRIGTLHAPDCELGVKLAAVAALREQLSSDADDARLAELDVVVKVVLVLGSVRFRQE